MVSGRGHPRCRTNSAAGGERMESRGDGNVRPAFRDCCEPRRCEVVSHAEVPVDQASTRGPTVVDRGFQFAYQCAYQLMRTYWKLTRPTTHGTLVTLWNQGEVLLVRNSYVRYYSAHRS